MKKSRVIFWYMIISVTAFAQHAVIRGVVRNESDGALMSDVAVIINGTANTNTDSKGVFQFSEVAIGTHKLSITLLGYEKAERIINIISELEVVEIPEIKLKSSAIQFPEIVISESLSNYSYKYQGSNIIISSRDIELSKPVGTEEILKKVSGINVSGDMGISNRLNVGIRGSYPRRSVNILLMEDGTPIAPAPYLAPEAYYNPPADRLDGIEIMKGTDILAYGSNTMYGTINYITKKPPLKPTLGVNLSGGENGYHSEYVTYGGTWDKVGAELQVLNKYFDGFQDNSQSSIFNTTAKLHSELTARSSVYMKLNYHQEESKASYSALTPYTFKMDPWQNPFDADDLTTKRYGVDLSYNYKLSNNFILSSKIYVSQFQRDWWRQENTLIKASTAKAYLGNNLYNERYSYLDGQSFGINDYIRVGKVTGGKESTRARNRLFRVGGAQQTLRYNVDKEKFKMNLEGTIKGHWESFANVEIKNDSSRFARSGTIDRDQYYELAAYSGFIKDKLTYSKIAFTPSIRYEFVKMYGFDKLAISKMSGNDGSKYFGSQKNTYTSFIPGAAIAYDLINKPSNKLNIFGGIYKGYTAPIADFAFLNVEDGIVSSPTTSKPINREPEVSLNFEVGIRSDLLNKFANVQLTYFNNNVKNYYSAGRNEAFQTLGAVNINGIESSINLYLHKLFNAENHELVLNLSGTLMNGTILSGLLKDADLLKAKHTDATKAELITKINSERKGFDVYFSNVAGQDSLITSNLSVVDFGKIKRLDFIFGESGISNNSIPYLPPFILNAGFTYAFKGLSISANINYVASQYTDYLNFDSETAEGAIGKLQAFKTIDANIAYSFERHNAKYLNGLSLFVAAKNITDEVYQASRLHRLSSGIMPGGFRQINAGLKFKF
ncbi:MAG: TonB-dependent receptor [Bacteroidetes bacterium]|nr:TonB-dependent receptor [Bacteroidota bacterium]